jgi:DNA-binding MarR family transcriptional regulator
MALEDVADQLHSLAIHLLRRVRQVDAETGISAARLSALSVIGFGGPCTVSDLAAAEQVAIPTISKIVAALVADGLVTRQPDEHDRRVVRLAATEAGMARLRAGRARRVAQIVALLERLPPDEIAAVRTAVTALNRAIEE